MLQLLQNHFNSYYTDTQCSLLSFLWFRVICGSIVIVGFQCPMIWTKVYNYILLFVSGAQSNRNNKTLQAQTWLVTINLLPYTVVLNLKTVCHLVELNSIKNDSKTINFFHFILATVDNCQYNSLNRSMKHCCVHNLHFTTIHPAFYYHDDCNLMPQT